MGDSCFCGLWSCFAEFFPFYPSEEAQPLRQSGAISEEDFRRRINFLSEVPLFRRLPRAQYPLLAWRLRARWWRVGDTVLEAGAIPTEFSLVAQGRAEVEVLVDDGTTICEPLRPGDYFGEKLLEQGLERDSPARIIASTGLVTLSITADEFEEFGLRKLLRFPKRRALEASQGNETTCRSKLNSRLDKSPEDIAFISEAVRANRNLRSLVDLRDATVKKICEVAERQEVPTGTQVVQRGMYGGMFYIVHSGSFELRLGDDDDATPEDVLQARLRSSSSLETIASEMKRRMHRKERFLHMLIHTEDICCELSRSPSMTSMPVASPAFPQDQGADAFRRVNSCDDTSGCEDIFSRQCSLGGTSNFSESLQLPKLNLPKLNLETEDGPHASPRAAMGTRARDAASRSFRRAFQMQLKRSELVPESPRTVPADPVPPAESLQVPGTPRNMVASGSWPGLPAENVDIFRRCISSDDRFQSHTLPLPQWEEEDTPRRCVSSSHMLPSPRGSYLEEVEAADEILTERARRNRGVLGVRTCGDSFGELALLYNIPRTSNAVALEDSVVWAVSQTAFRRVMLHKQQGRYDRIVEYLDQVDLLQGLLSEEKLQLAQNFLTETFRPGDWIVRQGERQNVWYIIVKGECAMLRAVDGEGDEDRQDELATLRPAMYFGERALLKDAPSEFSVKVCSDTDVRCLLLDGPTFTDLVRLLKNDPAVRHAVEDDLLNFAQYKGGEKQKLSGLLPRLKLEKSGTSLSDIEDQQSRQITCPLRLDPTVAMDTRSLDRVGTLGAGAYGVVTLERDPATGQMFALKTLSKGLICQNKLQQNVRDEREILTMVDSPFTITLLGTFRDERYIYMLFEPVLGGDLHDHIHMEPAAFRESATYTFIIACMVLALEHLHERGIVFRDLKPENVLLARNGYPKLCDFGFAKFVHGRAMTLCGTPEYVAPEVIGHGGYDRMVDWWAVGILTFELITGTTPFADDDEDAPPVVIFCNIKAGIGEVEFPFRTPETVTFIKSLLKRNPAHRLGIGGAAQVMRHSMLNNFDFGALSSQKMEAPYQPQAVGPEDMTLDAGDEDIGLPPYVEYADDGSGWDTVF